MYALKIEFFQLPVFATNYFLLAANKRLINFTPPSKITQQGNEKINRHINYTRPCRHKTQSCTTIDGCGNKNYINARSP